MTSASIFIIFGVLLLISAPVAIAMFLAGIIPISAFTTINPVSAVQRMFSSIDQFSLLAIPLFIISGGLMTKGGVSKRLVNLAEELLGWLPGGLAVVTFFASAMFGAISGSASATVVAIGGIMMPAMVNAGYSREFALTTAAAAGWLGVIIPPSLPMIIYTVAVSGVSVSDVFIGGVIPGIMLAGGMSVYGIIYGAKHVRERHKFSIKGVGKALVDSIWALGMPLIILGGIYGGFFTPTEAAAVSVIYGLFVGVFVYKEINIKDVIGTIRGSLSTCGMVYMLFLAAAVFSYIMTRQGIPDAIALFVTDYATNKFIFWLLVTVILLVVGCIMDTGPAILILGPIFAEMLPTFGIDPAVFGVIMVVNLGIGLMTPPVGINLYVACGLEGDKFDTILNKHLIFYVLLAIAVLCVLMAFPGLISFLPSLMK